MNFAEIDRQQREYAARALAAQATAAHALSRLLQEAERSDSGQAGRIAQFIAATYNGNAYAFDLFDLRAVDVAISDDMLACLDALRWGKSDLYKLVPDGDRRIQALCAVWGIQART
jgi:hypothetical protein